jgi:arginase
MRQSILTPSLTPSRPEGRSAIAIIGAPLDMGAGRRGVDMGPSALRLAGLNARLASLGYTVEDLGNVSVVQQESVSSGPENAKYLPQIAKSCEKLAQMVNGAVKAGKFPLVLGGDHSLAVGSVAGVAAAYRERQETIGLIWIDAHADMNTPETSPSGNVHGMPLACCIGHGPRELVEILGFSPKVSARNVVLIGIRDVDRRESE